MAAGDLPATVAPGQPITAVWGNGVVDDLTRLRSVIEQPFDHAGINGGPGGYDLGTTALGPFPYTVRVTVRANIWAGFAPGFCVVSGDIYALVNGSTRGFGNRFVNAGTWLSSQIIWSYTINAGSPAGFKTRCSIPQSEQNLSAWANSHGTYHVQRFGTP